MRIDRERERERKRVRNRHTERRGNYFRRTNEEANRQTETEAERWERGMNWVRKRASDSNRTD